jgi:hypothetical protein
MTFIQRVYSYTSDPCPVAATVCICFALLYNTPDKQPASWVFTHVTDGSGWGSKFFSFLLGFISVAWTMTDYDGTTQSAPYFLLLINLN